MVGVYSRTQHRGQSQTNAGGFENWKCGLCELRCYLLSVGLELPRAIVKRKLMDCVFAKPKSVLIYRLLKLRLQILLFVYQICRMKYGVRCSLTYSRSKEYSTLLPPFLWRLQQFLPANNRTDSVSWTFISDAVIEFFSSSSYERKIWNIKMNIVNLDGDFFSAFFEKHGAKVHSLKLHECYVAQPGLLKDIIV